MLERTEMSMLRWMMEIKRIEKIRNVEIRARPGVANISEKITEARLRWLGHVDRDCRRCSNENMEVGGHRKIGSTKLSRSDAIRRHDAERSEDRRSTRSENVEI